MKVPDRKPVTPQCFPLVVGVHGDTYTSKYFDAVPENSAVAISESLGISFVAIDRTSYNDSTSLPDPPQRSKYLQEEGKHLHHYVLPKLWLAYGHPSGATTMMVMGHSLGTCVAAVAAGVYCQDAQPQYPFGGVTPSGLGVAAADSTLAMEKLRDDDNNKERGIMQEGKDILTLGEESEGRASAAIRGLYQALNHSLGKAEVMDLATLWPEYWKRYATAVAMPVMTSTGDADALWKSTRENAEAFGAAFPNAARLESGILLRVGAPHCMELSYWGAGWLLRCFGFAAECTASEMVT